MCSVARGGPTRDLTPTYKDMGIVVLLPAGTRSRYLCPRIHEERGCSIPSYCKSWLLCLCTPDFPQRDNSGNDHCINEYNIYNTCASVGPSHL